jgi:hypothetical protein
MKLLCRWVELTKDLTHCWVYGLGDMRAQTQHTQHRFFVLPIGTHTNFAVITMLSQKMCVTNLKFKRNETCKLNWSVLRNRIIFMRLWLRVKILMRLRLLPYCIDRQIKTNLSLNTCWTILLMWCVLFILLKIRAELVINYNILCHF